MVSLVVSSAPPPGVCPIRWHCRLSTRGTRTHRTHSSNRTRHTHTHFLLLPAPARVLPSLPSLLAPVPAPRSSVPAVGGVGRSRVHSRTRARTRAHAHTAHAHLLFQQCTPGPAQDTRSPVARSKRRSSLRTSLVAPAKLKKRHCYCTVAYLGVCSLSRSAACSRCCMRQRPARLAGSTSSPARSSLSSAASRRALRF